MKPVSCLSLILALASLAIPEFVSGQPAERLAGDYVIVDQRRAGDVAGGPTDVTAREALGSKVRFSEKLIWWDGTECSAWSVAGTASASVNLADPILSDTQVPPVDGPNTVGDRRQNRHLEIRCGSVPFAVVTQVDDRVLIAPSPSGLTYFILERPLSAKQIGTFQSQLRSMKFLLSEPASDWDEDSLMAVSSYAEYRGAEFAFRRAAITENLLDGLAVLMPDEQHGLVKLVYSGAVAAYFYGEELELLPRSHGVRSLAFRFEGDGREYAFTPEGELFDTDWSFDIFSPDGAYVVLLQDRYGPYHAVRTDHLKAYLRGERGPDHVVGRRADPHASVHSAARWLPGNVLEYQVACCGETETLRWTAGATAESGGAPLLVQYRPEIAGRLGDLPQIRLDDLTGAILQLGELNRTALQSPGRWENGNIALGADPDQYVPSDAELLAGEYGDRLTAFLDGLSADQIAGAWTGRARMPGPLSYRRFDFRQVDVIGSGRFYYASPPLEAVRDLNAR